MTADQSRPVPRASEVEKLAQIRALIRDDHLIEYMGMEYLPVPEVRAVLDAVSVDATPAQESHYFGDGCGIEVQHDTRHLPPLTMDDLVEIAARIEVPRPVDAAPPQGIDRDAAEDLLNEVWADCRTNRFTISQWVDRIEALVRPVEGAILTPEEATLAADALRAAFDGTSPQFHEADVLASRLEASS